MNRRTFSKMLVSLLPAAWVASKVKGEPKPPVANRTCCKRCGREGDTFNSLCAQCYMGYATGTPPEIVLADQSSFPPGFDASKGITKLYIKGGTIDWAPRPDSPNPA